MASIKFLKKQISGLTSELALSALLSKAELTTENVAKINAVLAEIYDFEDNYRLKAHVYTNGKSAKEVRTYYRQLFAELQQAAQSLIEKIEQL
jgi:hypothetical protein